MGGGPEKGKYYAENGGLFVLGSLATRLPDMQAAAAAASSAGEAGRGPGGRGCRGVVAGCRGLGAELSAQSTLSAHKRGAPRGR